MSNILFFFASCYPFGTGETFIENEIEYLTNAFEKVVIVSNNTENEQTRHVPNNVDLVRKDYELSKQHKILAVKTIFSSEFWKELKTIRTIYKRPLNTIILNTMLQSWHKAKCWQPFINKLVNKHTHTHDRVFLYSYWNNDIALALAQYRKKNIDCKAVTRMHGWDVYFEANESNYLPFRKYIFKNLSQIFAISEKGKSYYKKWFPELSHKISVSRLGVKQNKQNPGNTTDKLQLLSVSNMIPIKNLETLIDALGLLNINFHWTHIGDGHLRSKLEKKAKHKIPGRYTFKGRIPNYEVLTYMQKQPIDLFINVSLSEGIPVSIMEAFSYGIPAIATNVGGNDEIVPDPFLISSPQNTQQIASKLRDYFTKNAMEKKQIKENVYGIWHDKYNSKNNYTQFTQTILSI